jgi:hypothetical protein
MPIDRNKNSVLRQLAALQRMPCRELQEKWRDLYGNEPPNYGQIFMRRQLAYRIQELFYGGLKKDVKAELLKSETERADSKKNRDAAFTVGTRLVRTWNNKEYEVKVVPGGFEYEGQKFRSLSAVAQKITGAHWNGRHFFGLPKMDRKPRGERIKTNHHRRKK